MTFEIWLKSKSWHTLELCKTIVWNIQINVRKELRSGHRFWLCVHCYIDLIAMIIAVAMNLIYIFLSTVDKFYNLFSRCHVRVTVNRHCTVKYGIPSVIATSVVFHKGGLLTWAHIFIVNKNIPIIFGCTVLREDIFIHLTALFNKFYIIK